MKLSFGTKLASLVTLVGSLALFESPGTEAEVADPGVEEAKPTLSFAPPAGVWPDWCVATAYLALESARYEAHAGYWLALGKCVNSDDPLYSCLVEAQEERQDALDVAEDQFQERLALCVLLGPGKYLPDLDPNDFSTNVTNPYFPLVPGRTLIYEANTPEGIEHIEVAASSDTICIDGIDCRIVRDVVTIGGELIEDTFDWYAQRNDGSVWYIGEIARNYEDGELVDLDGSWRSGVDGAAAGTLMQATPTVGTTYRQEFLLGEAEDVATVIASGVTVTVPAGTFNNCIVTEDWTPLEPGVREHKTYAPGVGMVKEVNLGSGEVLELIQIVN